MLLSLLLSQASAAASQAAPQDMPSVDLRAATRELDCPESRIEAEVVVCASRDGSNPNRLPLLSDDDRDPQWRLRLGPTTVKPEMKTDRFGLATPTVGATVPF
ncbi:hypothetical protein [Sphingomonas sp. 3-13AW]|jgi:hypothetical protein|uniref:hypothetical protein n=1 Tax=Sphingomonas sp. 3-13AW TaxID=3050450 RepID=UPI003BB60F52